MASRRGSQARAAVDRSFEELYRGHRADVFRAALREVGNVHDAEDVTQAAFVDAYRAVLRGSEPEAPRAWLLAIAENVRRRRFRTSQRRPREEPIDLDVALAAELPHEQARALADGLAALPEEQRRVFALRELGGRSYEEIADEVGTSVGAVQMSLFRARRTLRDLLEPPTVERRRPGLFLPLPGWLSGLASRAQSVVVAPGTVGAVGATAVAVGTSLVVTEVPAGGARPAPVEQRTAAVAAGTPRAVVRVTRAPAPAGAVPFRAATSAAFPLSVTAVAAPATAEPAASAPAAAATPPLEAAAEPVATPVAASEDAITATAEGTVAGTTTPVVRAAGATVEELLAPGSAPVVEAVAAPVVERAAPVVEKVVPVVENAAPVLAKAAPVVEKAAPLIERAAPVVEKVAPIVTPVVETAVGAAGAAGASAPPLPMPVPPGALPPAP